MNKKEAIKMIKLSFGATALHLTDHIDVNRYLRDDMSDDPIKDYLDALESLLVETFHGKEMTRLDFSTAKQGTSEAVTLWATRLKTLFKLAHPDVPVKEIDQDYRINDRFIDGLSSSEMKKFVLEQKENEEKLPKLRQHCLKYERVKIRCSLITDETDGKGKIKEEPQTQSHDTKHIGHLNVIQS